LLYLLIWNIQGPFWMWAASSALLGLGFTFFSGAGEAWLVDSLKFSKYKGELESVFAKGQVAAGIAMLSGSVAGGIVAQVTNLGVPYIIRAVLLGITLTIAYIFMKDWGFTPRKGATVAGDVKQIFNKSIDHGLRNPPVKWIMLAAPFGAGVSFYAFYALQPFLLELYGDSTAYSIAGLTAAIVAGSQIVGGMTAPKLRKIFSKRTSAMIASAILSSLLLLLLGLTTDFWVAIGLITIWGLTFAAITPIQQAYLNKHIPSEERATVLSFASLMGSTGGVVVQPILGKVADVWSYSASYLAAGAVQALALPFILKARKTNPKHDDIK
jgi:MFS family permease